MEDTLSRVLLSPSVVERWNKEGGEQIREAIARGVVRLPDEVGDELARVEPDGSLTKN